MTKETPKSHVRAKRGRTGPPLIVRALPAPVVSPSGELLRYYETLSGAMGPMRWWPGETPFEVIVGAILTQSTGWVNVERAIANLRSAGMLTESAMFRVRPARLAVLVRPSGYFRQKAKKLKAFLRFLHEEYQGSLEKMFQTP